MVIRGVQVLTQTGFGAALIQRKGGFDSAKDTAFTLFAIRGIVLAICMIPLSAMMSYWFKQDELRLLILVCGLTFVFGGFSNINYVAAMRELDFRKVAMLENAAAVASFAASVVLAFYWRSVWALVVGFVVSSAMKTVLSYTLIAGRPQFQLDRQIAGELFRYGKFITGASILTFIATEIDTVAIAKMTNPTQLGYYTVAFTLATFPAAHVAFVISNIMFSVFSKIQEDARMLRDTFLKMLDVIASLILPVVAGMAIAASELITTLYGAAWADSVIPFQYLCITGALEALVTAFGYVLSAVGRPEVSLRIAVLRFTIIGILIVPAIHLGGIKGAAVAMSIATCIAFVYGASRSSSALGVRLHDVAQVLLKAAAKSLLVVIGILALDAILPAETPFRLAWLILIAALVYLPLNYRAAKSVLARRLGS
jgi:PST family polysaccharide transporter/lipopolysaccharide exporter